MLIWVWAERKRNEASSCTTSSQDYEKMNSLRCRCSEERIREFLAEAQKHGVKNVKTPKAWACLPYARREVETKMMRAAKENIDPIHLFVRRRGIMEASRKRRRKALTEQTMERLPRSPAAMDHLEFQGYLCFHYSFVDSEVHFWYEHPGRSFVAMVALDGRTGELKDIVVTEDHASALKKLEEEGG